MYSKQSLQQRNSSCCLSSAPAASRNTRSRSTWVAQKVAQLACRWPSLTPRCGTRRRCSAHYPEAMPATVEIRRAADRAVTATPWLKSRHSLSFSDYYDPANTHHGQLEVNNDDAVQHGTGCDTHP